MFFKKLFCGARPETGRNETSKEQGQIRFCFTDQKAHLPADQTREEILQMGGIDAKRVICCLPVNGGQLSSVTDSPENTTIHHGVSEITEEFKSYDDARRPNNDFIFSSYLLGGLRDSVVKILIIS